MANDVLARMAVQIDAQTAQFGKALNVLNQQLNKFGSTVAKQNNVIQNFEAKIAGIQRSLGSLGVAFGAFQVAAVLKNAVQSIIDFEKQLSTVRAITGATGSQFDALRKDALRLGAATQFTATEVAKLQTEYGRLGFTTDEILAATEATLQLSIATGEDLAASADVAGSTVRAFGLSATETQRVVDIMASSFNKSALALDNFRDSMKYVAPIAAAANVSVEETTALLGILADAGIRGSQAGTGLRRIITDLAKDGRPLSERLKELSERGLTFGGAMDEVGRFAQSALLVLTKNVDKVDDLTASLQDAAGAGKEAADIMQDNLAGSIDRLTSAYDGLIQQQGPLADGLRDVVDALTNILSAGNDAANGFGKFVDAIITYTPNIVSLSRAVNSIFESIDKEREEFTKKAIVDAKRLYEEAKLAGNREDALQYARVIAELSNELGLVTDKAVEFKETAAEIVPDPGLVELLEQRITELGDAIKKATSIGEIRQLQAELGRVQMTLDSILKPGKQPEPIVIPIEFGDLKIDVEQIQESLDKINLNELGIDNKDGIVIPITVEPDPENIDKLDEHVEKIKARLEAFRDAVDSTIRGGLQDVIVGFAEDLGNAAAGVGNFGDNILKAVTGFMKQFGALMIAAGTAKTIFDRLASLPGPAVIAAGVALVAAAQAVNAHLSGGIGGSGVQSASSASIAGAAQAVNYNNGIQVEVVGELRASGQDLVAVINNQGRRDNRTRG